MDLRDSFDGTVGRTPLIRLREASRKTGCEVLGKTEFLNPGGSIKDRLCLGHSNGVNVAGALRLARELGPGHTIVTALCDSGLLYKAKLFNPAFLREKGLPVPDWLENG